jgi:hypothetical protein
MSGPFKHTPFSIFKIYHAVFLHYTTDYDYQLYNGKTSYKLETFEKRKDKYSFVKLAKIFEYHDLAEVQYYIAWLFFSGDGWVVPKSIQIEVLQFELEWKNYGHMRVESFKDDIHKIGVNNTYQRIHELLTVGEIHFCTLLILDALTSIIDKMNGKLAGQFLWDAKYKKLKKFRPFYFRHEPIHEINFKQLIPENLIWVE